MKSFNLRKSPTTEAETLDDVINFIKNKIDDNFGAILIEPEGRIAKKCYKDIEDYLKRYIDQLFLQNK